MKQAAITFPIRRSVIVCVLLTSAAFLAFPLAAAEDIKEEDLRAEIVYRCHYQMGEFGAEGVDVCVKGDLSAMQALKTYPQQAGEIVQRCTRQVHIIGWELAKSCVDKDIAAESALAGYAEKHAMVLERCRAKFVGRGPARVKACVDEQIAAGGEAKKD
jgi:hypothetical protein